MKAFKMRLRARGEPVERPKQEITAKVRALEQLTNPFMCTNRTIQTEIHKSMRQKHGTRDTIMNAKDSKNTN